MASSRGEFLVGSGAVAVCAAVGSQRALGEGPGACGVDAYSQEWISIRRA
jgi:hypothetical protein